MSEPSDSKTQPCMPCRGSGEVVSNLGGEACKVTCPWCRGGGIRLQDADAQAWREEQAMRPDSVPR